MGLKNHSTEAQAAVASFGSAALAFTIPSNAKTPAQASFQNTGTAGYWYVQFQRNVVGSGPTTTVYSKKLAPGEPWTEGEPPTGDVYLLADGSANGPCAYYASWTQ